MDTLSNSTTAPEISTLVSGTDKSEVLHCLTAFDLQKLSMKDLRSLLALFTAINETVCAFLNQGRFASGHVYNDAGEIGDGLLDHLNLCIAMVDQAAKDATPATPEEAEDRAWLLLQRAAHYSENLPRFLVATAQLSLAVSEVEAQA